MLSDKEVYTAAEVIPPNRGMFKSRLLLEYAQRMRATAALLEINNNAKDKEITRLEINNIELKNKNTWLENAKNGLVDTISSNHRSIEELKTQQNQIQTDLKVENSHHEALKERIKEVVLDNDYAIQKLEISHERRVKRLEGLIKKHNRAWNILRRRVYVGLLTFGALIAVSFGVGFSPQILAIVGAVRHAAGG